jgi:hypothetical protein
MKGGGVKSKNLVHIKKGKQRGKSTVIWGPPQMIYVSVVLVPAHGTILILPVAVALW